MQLPVERRIAKLYNICGAHAYVGSSERQRVMQTQALWFAADLPRIMNIRLRTGTALRSVSTMP